MKVKEFKKMAEEKGSIHFADKSYSGLSWEDWYKLASATSRIDYGCRFDFREINSGLCALYRKRDAQGSSKMCCCSGCYDSMGYLRFVQNTPAALAVVSSRFKPEVGFWRKNKGCSLPRKYRSAVCLGYRCFKETIYTGKINMLMAFMEGLRHGHDFSRREIYTMGRALAKII